MWKQLHQAVTSHCRQLWRRRGGLRGLLALVTLRRAPRESEGAARARFWDEMREGQREADARCARGDP